jgi:hypothetical protein
VQPQPLSLDEKCKKLKETIKRVATNTISYTRKQANKEWFDQESARVNKGKNAARDRAIQIKTRIRSHECLETSPDKSEAFDLKKGKAARQRGFNRD